MMDFQYTQENGCNIISSPVGGRHETIKISNLFRFHFIVSKFTMQPCRKSTRHLNRNSTNTMQSKHNGTNDSLLYGHQHIIVLREMKWQIRLQKRATGKRLVQLIISCSKTEIKKSIGTENKGEIAKTMGERKERTVVL